MNAAVSLRHTAIQRLFLILAGLWVGSLCTVGYLVVPTIFANLQDRQVAGIIAAAIFQAEAYVSVAVCVTLLLLANALIKRKLDAYRSIRWLVFILLLISALTCVGLITYMNGLRAEALLLGMPVMASPSAALFGRLHGISSGLFLLQSVLGLWIVWRLSRNPIAASS
jgi:hypothetical protein